MGQVTINSGPPAATDRPDMIPKSKWLDLMRTKRDFLAVKIKYDCRCLLEFIRDAEEMWQELGFESVADMIRDGYQLDPSEVDLALAWLKIKDPDEAVKYEEAVSEGRKLMQHGGDRRSEGFREQDKQLNLKRGPTNAYLLARLQRDHPEIDVEKYPSVRQAAIAAGIVKMPTAYQRILKLIPKLTSSERVQLREIL